MYCDISIIIQYRQKFSLAAHFTAIACVRTYIPVKEDVVLWANAQVLSYDVHVPPDVTAIDVGCASCRLIQPCQHRPTGKH